MASSLPARPVRLLGSEDETPKLACPACDHGLGDVILKPDAPALIPGVEIEPFPLWPDDRGYFLEVARLGQGKAAGLPADQTQVSAALSYPGTIKAFHYHRKQTDYWTAVSGMFQVVLVDLRADAETFGARNTLYVGSLRPWRLWIPPGVGHGYKVVGSDPGILVYLTSRHYDPSDEGRIAYNDPGVSYDWELQHK